MMLSKRKKIDIEINSDQLGCSEKRKKKEKGEKKNDKKSEI